MIRTLLGTALTTLVLVSVSQAREASSAGQDRLMIVDGNKRRVVYDDGRNDLYCVTRRRVVGYNDYGRPIYRRNMRCR